jgi:alkylation response protein AidB-like acyl-CoA dehydrogenase
MAADFDLFKVSEEHDLLREAVRSLCEEKIAPFAADVDGARTPWRPAS